MKTQKKKLMRDKAGGIFSGLCQGLGERFDLSPWIFRALFIIPALPFVLNIFSTIASIGIYIILSIVIKDKKQIEKNRVASVDYEVINDTGKEDSDETDVNQ